ncbi:MAG: hypothetical protein ABI612_10500 [Betaproteobacteria bacterium]
MSSLYEPVDWDSGDQGAHGRCDALAHGFSSQLWLTTHRGVVALVVVIVLLMLLGVSLAVVIGLHSAISY